MESMDFNVDFLQSNSDMMMGVSEYTGFNVDDLLAGDEDLSLMAVTDVTLASFNLLDADDKYFDIMQDSDTAVTVKSEQYPAKSPWHESDSGVSETLSFVGSPIDPNSIVVEDSFLQAQTTSKPSILQQVPKIADTGAGDDLMTYLLGTGASSPGTKEGNVAAKNPKLSASGRPLRKCSQRKVAIQADVSDSEESNPGDIPSATTQKAVSVQPLNYFNDTPSFNNRSDIKIVKVMKPPACSPEATHEDIVKALEERSKKNAQQAKINREKKKAYIKNLEDDLDYMRKENKELTTEKGKMQKHISNLEDEVEYLKSVLANASALSGLLKNISNVKEVKLSASITGRKRAAPDDHAYNMVESVPEKRSRLVKENLKKAGVCLHVNDGEACLEFCAHCSSLAQKTHGRRGKS